MKEKYRTEVKSVRAFVQRVACEIVNRGYVFYVTGHVPEGCDPEALEQKLDELYSYKLSKQPAPSKKAPGSVEPAPSSLRTLLRDVRNPRPKSMVRGGELSAGGEEEARLQGEGPSEGAAQV